VGLNLGAGRRLAEARMTQTWRIGELVEVSDPVTFEVLQVLDDVYDGPARFKFVRATAVSESVAGGQFVAEQAAELHVPVGATGLSVDMRAVCDADPDDPSMVGRVVRLKGLPTGGQVTAQRWPVEESNEVIVEGS